MESLKSWVCCLIPGFRRRYRQECIKRTRMERRREKIKQINRLQASRNYQARQSRIKDQIAFDYSRTVVVWSQLEEESRDEIIKKMHSFGEVTYIQDRWSVKESGDKTWHGALVGYARAKEANIASLELPVQIRYARSTMLETVIDTLTDCELLHPDDRKVSTKVVISRKVPLRLEEVNDLYRELCKYGRVQTFFVNNRQTTIGAFCEVTYTYVTQAYLAMLMTNGLMYRRGVLNASIDKTQKDSEILRDAKDIIIVTSQCFFPC